MVYKSCALLGTNVGTNLENVDGVVVVAVVGAVGPEGAHRAIEPIHHHAPQIGLGRVRSR